MKPASFKSNLLMTIMLGMILTATSCGKDDITKRCCECERPATQQGANTMSFRIDGKQWSNCNVTNGGSLNDFRTVMVSLPYGDYSRLDVQGRRNFEGPDYEQLGIMINDPQEGYLTYNPQEHGLFTFHTRGSSIYSTVYHTDTTKSYFLNITKVDWDKRIISGEFECELKEAPGGANFPNLKITEGRFDTTF